MNRKTSRQSAQPTPRRNRRSIRLRGYDYSQAGAYFVTACAHNRQCLFGDIDEGKIRLNEKGLVIQQCWDDIPVHFPHVELDAFMIMPNHVHGILVFNESAGANDFSPLPQVGQRPKGTSKTLGSVVRGFKIGVTKWIRQNSPLNNVWQRNYWEHIIRNEQELNRIREYIENNPAQWALDQLNPATPRRGEKFFAPTSAPTEIREQASAYTWEAWMV